MALMAHANVIDEIGPVVIDSSGSLASVMRREKVRVHALNTSADENSTIDSGSNDNSTTANEDEEKEESANENATTDEGRKEGKREKKGRKEEKKEEEGRKEGKREKEERKESTDENDTTDDEKKKKKRNPVRHSHKDETHAKKAHMSRTDLVFDYKEELIPGACEAHYEFLGDLTNAECAQRCYETYGCTRFSAGGCRLGCRISAPNRNNMVSGKEVPAAPDGQCIPQQENGAGECIVYSLSFFHFVEQPGACSAHYELHDTVLNKAECAHACKNTPGCKKFSHEPNCMYGCRLSKCDANAGGSTCPSDEQCTLATDMGCATYELYR